VRWRGNGLSCNTWRDERGVSEVVIESTGNYLRPIWNVLGRRARMLPANVRVNKQVPGRDTDVEGAERLADLANRAHPRFAQARTSEAGPMTIEILGADDLHRFPAPAESSGGFASPYVAALIKAGPSFYVDNANVEMKAVSVDGKIVPLVINRSTTGNTDVCSPSAHYIDYTLHELAKRHPWIPRSMPTFIALVSRAVLATSEIDKTVFVNNWLFTTNPNPALSSSQITDITAKLVAAYPESAIVFRSINPSLDKQGRLALLDSGYELVRSRRVYVFDATCDENFKRHNTARDLRLLMNTQYEIVSSRQRLAANVPRMVKLYKDLYLNKHSHMNPGYNRNFFSLTIDKRVFTYRALAKNGRIDISYFIQNGVLTGAFVGYDRSLPRDLGLYRLAIAIAIDQARKQGLLVNLSGGAGHFKMVRGAVPVEEFDAVYDHHLPVHRRAAWRALLLSGRWAAAHKAAIY
jgi:hypothetical protein